MIPASWLHRLPERWCERYLAGWWSPLSGSTFRRGRACRQTDYERLCCCWKSPRDTAEAGLSRQDTDDLGKRRTSQMQNFTAFRLKSGCIFTAGLWVECSLLTGGAEGGLLGPWGGAHGPSGAAETASRSRGRAVSARLAGQLARWSDRTAVTGGTEVTMGTVRGSGSGAAAQAHVSADVKQQVPDLNRKTSPRAVGAEAERAVSESGWESH